MCTLFADNNFVIMLMCIVVHNLYLIVSKLLMTTYCGLSDNSVRSVGTCNLCLMYYMASLASGGFVLTNGLFKSPVSGPGPGVVPFPAAGLAPPALPAIYPGYTEVYPGPEYTAVYPIQDDVLLGYK